MRHRNPPENALAAAGDPPLIDAEPTKDFFISMLVKDIELIPAISDLVDNCVDGARRARKTERFDGFWVRLELNANHFRIADNCGGIPIEIAQKYAFRFGRPGGMTATPHSVGQFGVGMKRALFKLGGRFVIESATADSDFTVDVDVAKWRDQRDWQFKFTDFDDHASVPETDQGTKIEVTELHPNVAKDFALEAFVGRLREELELRHQQTMDDGLAISVNGIPLTVDVAELLYSDELQPAFDELSFNGGARSPVQARIWAGISDSSPRDAGWYVFCNGRLVLGPDQTIVTGWGDRDESVMPKYHNQFARFRGYLFFDSDDASRLPWNTTKTSVDLDSDVYRTTRQRMLVLMRPVIDFLNRLDKEKEAAGDDRGPLEESLEKAGPVRLRDVAVSEVFRAPRPVAVPRGPAVGNINYSRPKTLIKRVQEAIGATTYREAGEKTFDYFVEAELGDE